MKKLFLIILIGSITGTSIAQRKQDLNMDRENFFRFGVKAGTNINKIQGQSYKDGFRYNFQLGGFMQFNFSDRFGIQPEVNFVQSQSEFSNDATSVYDDLFYGGTQGKAKLNYLEVPVLLNVNLGTSKRVKLQLGPAYSGLLKETVDSLQSPRSIYEKGEFSAVGGIWFQLPLVNLGARYKMGLTNVNAIDDQQKWKNQSIQLFVGLTF